MTVVLEALQSSHVELKDHGVTARTKLTSTLPPLHADRNHLYQVVYNLIYNAVEAISGTTDRDRLLEVTTALHDPNTIVVEVADTGPGVDPDRATEIFDAFVTTKPHGMGLGLAICRMIVERHDGQLSVSAANPRGAIFGLRCLSRIRLIDRSLSRPAWTVLLIASISRGAGNGLRRYATQPAAKAT